MWVNGLFPNRLAYLYGLEGVGKLSTVVTHCSNNNINLLYVNHLYFTETMHEEIFKKAKANAPCIVYYDKVDAMVADPRRCISFTATYSVTMDCVKDDVWVMLSGTNNISALVDHMVGLESLLDNIGCVVYTPVSTDHAYKGKVMMNMVRYLAGTDGFPYSVAHPDTHKQWDIFFKMLHQASEHCTHRDMWNFLLSVFRTFKQSVDVDAIQAQSGSRVALIKSNALMYPDLNLFQQYYDVLVVRRDMNGSDRRTLSKHDQPLLKTGVISDIYNTYLSFNPKRLIRVGSSSHPNTPTPSSTVTPSRVFGTPTHGLHAQPTPVGYKSKTRSAPVVDDADTFMLTPVKFSTPIRQADAPHAKSSSELKRPSIVERNKRDRESITQSLPTLPDFISQRSNMYPTPSSDSDSDGEYLSKRSRGTGYMHDDVIDEDERDADMQCNNKMKQVLLSYTCKA